MKSSKATLFFFVGLFSITACNKAFIIEDVNYAQYVESVLIPDENGIISDYRNSLSFSVASISDLEFGEDHNETISEIRLIRNRNGYYFLTADQFKNVYVFEPKKGELKLKETIEISELGLQSPVFNWRDPYVEIIANNREETHYLNEKGIIVEENEEGQS